MAYNVRHRMTLLRISSVFISYLYVFFFTAIVTAYRATSKRKIVRWQFLLVFLPLFLSVAVPYSIHSVFSLPVSLPVKSSQRLRKRRCLGQSFIRNCVDSHMIID